MHQRQDSDSSQKITCDLCCDVVLKIQLHYFCRYFYVVAWKINDGKEPVSSGNYDNNELVTYTEAENTSNPKPYIAAVVTFSGLVENVFVLGDGSNTSEPALNRRPSTSSDYYNGPLKPGTGYRIFQRFFINVQVHDVC
jgi:hypothetical protein